MQLSEVPFDKLKIGDKLISAVGTPGHITGFIPMDNACQQEDNEIEISWDDGKTSEIWHFWGMHVEYVG